MKKMLIVYYSWSNGNTKRIAEQLQAASGADICAIETAEPYEGSYEEVVAQGQDEVKRGYERPIQPIRFCVSDYDVIAVGTPAWWYTMAPAVKTFIASQEWQGKIVIPFMTNGGWPGHVIQDMKNACAEAECLCSMEVQFDSAGGSTMKTPQRDIDAWINEVQAVLV